MRAASAPSCMQQACRERVALRSMVHIRPHRFLHYNTAKAARGVRGLADVLCPPYDVVSPEPVSYTHLTLPTIYSV